MKRRFANQVEGDYSQCRIESEYFTGYICCIKIKNVKEPLIVNDGTGDICIKDENYKWLGLYPDNDKYAITIMFDDNGKLIEWYFDIAKKVGIDNGIPFEDDLYLDMVITPEGKEIVLDEDELLMAANQGNINQEDVDDAYKTLDYLKEKYVKNFDELVRFTKEIEERFN